MSALKDLSNQRFGSLVALEHVPGSKPTKWICRCDCGKETTVNASNLVRGYTTSCGCAARRASTRRGKPSGKHIDLTGQRYGRLVAKRFISRDKWLWQCDCGNTTIARASSVKKGETVSCGCYQKESRRSDAARQFGHVDGTSLTTVKSVMSGNLRSTNTTGYTGVKVRYNVAGTVFVAHITYKRRYIHLGSFPTLEQAVEARKKAEAKYFAPLLGNE